MCKELAWVVCRCGQDTRSDICTETVDIHPHVLAAEAGVFSRVRAARTCRSSIRLTGPPAAGSFSG
jgi:hypothetical protein